MRLLLDCMHGLRFLKKLIVYTSFDNSGSLFLHSSLIIPFSLYMPIVFFRINWYSLDNLFYSVSYFITSQFHWDIIVEVIAQRTLFSKFRNFTN